MSSAFDDHTDYFANELSVPPPVYFPVLDHYYLTMDIAYKKLLKRKLFIQFFSAFNFVMNPEEKEQATFA